MNQLLDKFNQKRRSISVPERKIFEFVNDKDKYD